MEKKYYKDIIVPVGGSDIASLTVVADKNLTGENSDGDKHVAQISMGGDGSYKMYKVDEEELIPQHYSSTGIIVAGKVEIHDDDECMYAINVKKMEFYRAGNFGLLAYVEKAEK